MRPKGRPVMILTLFPDWNPQAEVNKTMGLYLNIMIIPTNAGHCMGLTCPEDGFLGKDCKCYCKGEPPNIVIPCQNTTDEMFPDTTSGKYEIQI